jgi:hypothetical protein
MTAVTSGSTEAKAFLKKENKSRASAKKSFLPEHRTSMITDEETKKILDRSFEYLVALLEFIVYNFRFQIKHYLVIKFKDTISESFMRKGSETNWSELVVPDPEVASRFLELQDKIKSLEDSMREVQKLQQRV